MSFIKDFKDANADFSKFRDELLFHIKGDLIDVESADTELTKMFDMRSGIDAFQLVKGQVRGVAIRVQWGVNYRTFTIRYKRKNGTDTEYKKRAEAIFSESKGYLYPHLTIQAYLDKRGAAQSILGCCIVKTKDLYQHIFINMADLKTRKCPEGNEFIFIPFDDLKQTGMEIILFGDDYKNKNMAA